MAWVQRLSHNTLRQTLAYGSNPDNGCALIKVVSERVERTEILSMQRNEPSVSEYLRQVGYQNLTVKFLQKGN